MSDVRYRVTVGPSKSKEDAIAQAQVCEAAPDLLAACREAEDTFATFAEAEGFPSMGPECHGAIEALREAIDKATGQQDPQTQEHLAGTPGDWLNPPTCRSCGEPTKHPGTLCTRCESLERR